MDAAQFEKRLRGLSEAFTQLADELKNSEKPKKQLNVKVTYKLGANPATLSANTENISSAGVNDATNVVMSQVVKKFHKANVLVDGKVPPIILEIFDENNNVLHRQLTTLQSKWNIEPNGLKLYNSGVDKLFNQLQE